MTQLRTVSEVAAQLRVSRTHVYDLIARGEFSVVATGTGSRPASRIPAEEVEEYIARRTVPRRRKRGAA